MCSGGNGGFYLLTRSLSYQWLAWVFARPIPLALPFVALCHMAYRAMVTWSATISCCWPRRLTRLQPRSMDPLPRGCELKGSRCELP